MTKPILIIEDNEQNMYMMRFLLEMNGFVVEGAWDGQQGLEAAKRLLPRAILLDIQLPAMDGYTVAAELRKDPLLKETPIIAVTSYAMVGDREKVMAAGATGYIEKPINPETFVEEISGFFPRKDPQGADE
jgi:CheY-like chemotaxis protein